MQDAAGNQMQDRLFVVDDHRVTGVIAPLVPYNEIRVFGQEIDYLAFSLVPPLHPHNDIAGHITLRFTRYQYLLVRPPPPVAPL